MWVMARRRIANRLRAGLWPALVVGCLWLPLAVLLWETAGADGLGWPSVRQGALLGRSLIVAGGSTILAVFLGAPVALALGRLRLLGIIPGF